MSNYRKYKERDPADTVLEIQRILREIGLFPVMKWAEQPRPGARSCRVSLYPTGVGANGKGTDEIYAAASAYAELMERLSSGIVFDIRRRGELFRELGFREFPDERQMTIPGILADPDPLTACWMERFGYRDPVSRVAFLDLFRNRFGCDRDGILTVPFADPVQGKVVWIPLMLLLALFGSNGMAAGNTLEEAMVQGLSEIFERAALRELLSGRAVPPEIPEEVIRDFSFYPLVRQLRGEERYRVRLLDCSLGRGYPVVGICVQDLEKGTFGMNLGAHPSLAVAVERTLTEAMQGKTIEAFSAFSTLGTAEEAVSYQNALNIFKIASGVWPRGLLTGNPSYEYRPWTRWKGNGNQDFLREMFGLLRAEGWHPLVRDTSFLGFPSCQIVVPGMSELTQDPAVLSVMAANVAMTEACGRFPDLSRAEEEQLLRLIRFGEGSVDAFKSELGQPLSARYGNDRIAAWLCLKHGDWAGAEHFFGKRLRTEKDGEKRLLMECVLRYLRLRKAGTDAEEAIRAIRALYHPRIAEEVCRAVSDPEGIMQRLFPRMNCYGCEDCRARSECEYPARQELRKKVLRAMKKENVSQERLLDALARDGTRGLSPVLRETEHGDCPHVTE